MSRRKLGSGHIVDIRKIPRRTVPTHREDLELLPISQLAKQAGVPLSTAHKYVRQNQKQFHPVKGRRGKLYPVTDVITLKQIYDEAPHKHYKTPRKPDQPKGTLVKSNESSKQEGHAISTNRQVPAPGMLESNRANAQVTLQLQILSALKDIDSRHQTLLDQFDHLNRIIARTWESQQTFVESMNQTVERFRHQDEIIAMLLERNKTLEVECSRYKQLLSANEEVAASSSESHRCELGEEESVDAPKGGLWHKVFGR